MSSQDWNGGTPPPPPPPSSDTSSDIGNLQYFTLAFFVVGIAALLLALALILARCFSGFHLQLDGASHRSWVRNAQSTGNGGAIGSGVDLERGGDQSGFQPIVIPVKQAIIVVQPDGEPSLAITSEVLLKDAMIQVKESELEPLPLNYRRTRSASSSTLDLYRSGVTATGILSDVDSVGEGQQSPSRIVENDNNRQQQQQRQQHISPRQQQIRRTVSSGVSLSPGILIDVSLQQLLDRRHPQWSHRQAENVGSEICASPQQQPDLHTQEQESLEIERYHSCDEDKGGMNSPEAALTGEENTTKKSHKRRKKKRRAVTDAACQTDE